MAISTTGQMHRLAFLETAARGWWNALVPLGLPTTIFVTVDGSEDETEQVFERVCGFAQVLRVGQPRFAVGPYSGRLGVAANKNTGIEALWDAGVEHLFLSDDDAYPRRTLALEPHTRSGAPAHSMVNWGGHRLDFNRQGQPVWKWPRGSVLYMHRPAIHVVGGMIEEFGQGGHEHVEYSRRIHQMGLTNAPFPAPVYMSRHRGMGARAQWACEDMPKVGEPLPNVKHRRRKITSVKRPEGYWENAERIMSEMDGKPRYVNFRAGSNGRSPATMYPTN